MIAKALKEEVEIETTEYEGSALTAIVKTLALMPESLRRSTCIIVNPQTYGDILTEEDANGRSILDWNYENSLRAKVAGVPVVVSEKVDAIYVGSLKDGVKIGYSPRSLEAENQPRKDAVLFFFNVYTNACVVLPSAVKRLKKKQH